MGANPLIGVIYHWIGGFASATNFIPFRGIKRWSWEIYWLIQGFAAWIVAPWVSAPSSSRMSSPFSASRAPRQPWHTIFRGALWGLGGLTFGLAIRYLGLALGYAIALGLCMAFGTLIPPIYDGPIHTILHETAGQIILLGVLVCLIAVAVNGARRPTPRRRDHAGRKAEAGESDYSFGKGIAVAIFAGIMSSFFAFGLAAGKPSANRQNAAPRQPRSDLWQNLPILIVVLGEVSSPTSSGPPS